VVALINLCGSGSSGTTLLSNLLNRHPEIVCGEELGFFSKPIVYSDFDLLKRYSFLIKRYGVSSAPLFSDRSILRNTEYFHLDKSAFDYIKFSSDLQDFVGQFTADVLKRCNKQIFAEKTPENIFFLEEFLKEFPDAKVVHLVRDPRDVILSLMKRGVSLKQATLVWLGSVAAIQKNRGDQRLLEMRYEDLVHTPELILKRISAFLGVKYKPEYYFSNQFVSTCIERQKGFDSWLSSPGGGIASASVGKFRNDHEQFNAVYNYTLTKEYAEALKVEGFSIADLMRIYGYQEMGNRVPLLNVEYHPREPKCSYFRAKSIAICKEIFKEEKMKAGMII